MILLDEALADIENAMEIFNDDQMQPDGSYLLTEEDIDEIFEYLETAKHKINDFMKEN